MVFITATLLLLREVFLANQALTRTQLEAVSMLVLARGPSQISLAEEYVNFLTMKHLSYPRLSL